MRKVIIDIETPLIPIEGHRGLTKIWCIVTKELDVDDVRVWLPTDWDLFKEYHKTVDLWIAHNGLSFDFPVMSRLLGVEFTNVIDTFVISRLINYTGFSTHSLEELGQHLGEPKTPFADFSKLSQEMVDYCIQDVKVNERIYKMYQRYIEDEAWAESIKLEQDMVVINEDMSANGFKFNIPKAKELLFDIRNRMDKLERSFQETWPPELVEVNRIQYRVKADGTLYQTVINAQEKYPRTTLQGTELVCYDYEVFKPGSTKHRVTKLWEAGWNPVVKTKTHQKFSRAREGEMWGKSLLTPELYQEKKEHFDFYGWKVSEENLLTLPEEAPEGAKDLAQWLTLEGRRSSLEEWLGCVREDGRIHGKFWNIGAWTHRMSHSAPNQANIFSPFHGDARNAVEEIKKEYDYDLRALWCVDEDKLLVGTDAAGIQLRILAHYMKSEEYTQAILSGRKEDQTDIHNLNRRALGDVCRDRDVAKTYVYAFLLGAGTAKIAQILSCSKKQAKDAVNNFLEALPELKKLKNGLIPRDARRGYFVGLDGRKVLCDSEHLMLAGYLQNAEAIITKRWIREWTTKAREVGLWFRLVDYVHDETQTEVLNEVDADKLISIQNKAMKDVSEELGLFCPMDTESDIGKSWAETH